jgi:hypothetical protein
MKAISYRNLFKTLNGGTLARGWGEIQVRRGFPSGLRSSSTLGLACSPLRVTILIIGLSPLRDFVIPRCSVAKKSPDQAWFEQYLEFHCDDCGSDTGFGSRRRTFTERWLLPIFLLKPVRCAECFRRDYRSLFVPVKERIPEAVKKVATSAPRSDRNVA